MWHVTLSERPSLGLRLTSSTGSSGALRGQSENTVTYKVDISFDIYCNTSEGVVLTLLLLLLLLLMVKFTVLLVDSHKNAQELSVNLRAKRDHLRQRRAKRSAI